MRWTSLALGLVALLLLTVARPALAEQSAPFPDRIPLPNGFGPEGIATGRDTTFFVSSLLGGAIYRGDLSTGQGAVLVPTISPETNAVGLKVDLRTNHLFVAGGFDGTARVYNGDTGEQLATYQLTVPRPDYGPIINDVILTRNKAYFTDSCSTNLFKVSLGPHGALPDQSAVETIPMTGDFKFVQAPFSGLPCFPNANGIVATDDGKWLVIVNSLTEEIFRVNPRTGETRKIDVGQLVPNGDGLLLDGSTLYVVQNFLNQIAVIELSDNLTSGVITDYLTSPAFDVPATAAFFCDSLYAVNARFTTPVTPDTQYDVVKVAR